MPEVPYEFLALCIREFRKRKIMFTWSQSYTNVRGVAFSDKDGADSDSHFKTILKVSNHIY